MAVTLIEYSRKLNGTRYDPDRKKYIGYKIDIWIGGKRHREGRFKTNREAEEYIHELRLKYKYSKRGIKYHSTTAADIKLKDLVEKHLAELGKNSYKGRILLVKRVLNELLGITGEFARVTDLTYQHLKDFNKKRLSEKTIGRGTPVSEHTVDREMTEISSLLKHAGEYFEELEAYEPPKIPRLALSDIRRERTISDPERIALINYFARSREKHESDSQYFDRITIGHAFEFAGLTSSRRKEVVRLKKTDYFAKQNILKIIRWKTIKAKKQSVSVFSPVPKRVRELLELRAKLTGPSCEYFFSKDGSDAYGYLKALKLACEKLNIKYGRFTDGGLIFHDTRHTFVSTLLDGGADLETTRDLAGVSRDMILRYAHATPESRRKAMAILDRQTEAGPNIEKLSELFDKVCLGELKKPEFIAEIIMFWTHYSPNSKSAAA